MALPKLDTPRYEMKIPSTNKKVTYRPYLVREEKVLMLAMESNDQSQMVRALKDVINSCTEGSLEIDSLTMFDLEYVFLQLRAKSSGETTEVSIKCTSCEEKNPVTVDLSKVSVDVPKATEKKIKLTDKVGVVMKYPSINDMINIQESTESEVNKLFSVIAKSIDSIYSNDEIFDASEQSIDELKDFIDSLNTDQFNKIRTFVEEMPAATIAVDFTCKSCGTHNQMDVKGMANFFS